MESLFYIKVATKTAIAQKFRAIAALINPIIP
jgi:hypothetical protein